MGRIWGQLITLAAMAMVVHMPLRAETTETRVKVESSRPEASHRQLPHAETAGEVPPGSAAVVASNLPIIRVITQVQHQSGADIRLRGDLKDKHVTLIAPKPQPVAQILTLLEASNSDLLVKDKGGAFEIWDLESYYSQGRETKVYPLNEVQGNEVQASINSVLTPKHGVVHRNDRLNCLVVYDVPEKQAEVAELVQQLDKKLPTQVFTLRHGSAKEMAVHMESFLDISSTQVIADERTGKVILRAPESELRDAELLVRMFDVEAPAGTGNY